MAIISMIAYIISFPHLSTVTLKLLKFSTERDKSYT